ncbi:MAG: hypothetical protein RL596_2617 [Bacteroidota bacterium]|jgi:mono/diheme cytochrome c family protein
MKKFVRILAIVLLIVVIAVGGVAAYLSFALPNVGEPEKLTVALTPERIERGKYLANHVTLCVDCHSTRDWTKFAAPPIPGTLGKGGEIFTRDMGFPGLFYSANITPTHLSTWTDGELFRVITTGVNKKGKAMFPVMPYQSYGKMDREDVYDIIAYIRSLAPIESTVPASKVDFPMNFILNTIPKPASLSKKPAATDTLAYGAYLVNIAACGECHTPFEKGAFDETKRLAGGRTFPLPAGMLSSSNLTPDSTGIGAWSKEQFIARFKQYADTSYVPATINLQKDYNTIMPWTMYAGMKESDLSAIYAYLHSLKPITHKVEKFTKR